MRANTSEVRSKNVSSIDGNKLRYDNRSHYRIRNRNGSHRKSTTGGRIQLGTAVNKLNFFQFRLLLVENFNIRFHENNLQWPKRLSRSTPRNVPVMIAA